MKRLFRIILALVIIGVMVKFVAPDLFKPSTVRAFGDLVVNFHVPLNNPIFTVTNMAPGDPPQNRNVDVHNNASVSRLVSVKGVRTGGVGADPKLETVLDLVIKDGATPVYGTGSLTGPKSVKNFFDDSTATDGVKLNIINPGGDKTYNFKVTFPSSAGNDFQAKSVIFDLTFGEVTGNNVVINEVYYLVDPSKGLDSPKDRGILSVNGNNVTIVISGNGAWSKNKVVVTQLQACKLLQTNNTNVVTNVTSNTNTGGNSSSGNTGGSNSINTGGSQTNVNVSVGGSTNISSSSCGKMLGQNDEWVELFNPTDHDISLKDWTLTDNSGATSITHANKIIKAGGFALLSKDASTWTHWIVPAGALKVELGNQIGDGLDNAGDHLILKNSGATEVDRMSWGSDTTGFTPPAVNPLVPLGHSTERIVPGFDTDAVTDWHDQNPPTPGN